LLIFKMSTLKRKSLIMILIGMAGLPILIFHFVPIVKERMVDMTFGLKNTYQYAKYGDKGKDNNYYGGLTPRFQIWKCAVQVGNHDYLFGSGFGTDQKRLNECYVKSGLETFADEDYQTHNQYFNHYARGGFSGLLVLFVFYFFSLYKALKKRHAIHICLTLIIILVSMTENILNRHMGIVFFTFFNSLFFFSENDKANEF